jgi:uncharacterized protein YggE
MKRLLILILMAGAWSVSAFAQDQIDPPLITVTGQAEVLAPPDEAVFALAIENVDKDMIAANKRTDDSVKQVLAIAKRHNIKPEDIQTSRVSIQPKYNTDELEYEARRGVKRVLIGYEASKTVVIKLRDISRYESLLGEILTAGITRLSGLEFRDSQLRKHRDQARVMAIRAAKEKATLLAGEIGQSIGPAYSITETSGDYAPRTMQNASAGVAGNPSESESAIAPGSLSITAQVTVRFRLQ